MSRTKKFLYNSVSTAFHQVVIMAAGFITPLIMLKNYGSETNGLISSISQFIVYFNLVEAGLYVSAIYALYKPLADKNYQKINAVVSAARSFYIRAGYLFLALVIGLAIIYPILVPTDAVTPFNVGLLVFIIGFNGILEFFTLSKYRVLLSADQRMYVISLASVVHVVVNTLIVVVLGSMKVDIVILRAVALLSIFLRSFILMVYVKIKYKYINYREKPDFQALHHRWDAFYQEILRVVHFASPDLIITFILGNLKLVSVYAVFNLVMVGVTGILRIFISGLSASFGEVIAKGEIKILQKAYTDFEFSYYSLITVIYSVAFITISPFIKIYTKGVTDVNYDVPIIGFLIVLNGLLYNIKTPQAMLVMSAGLFKETKLQATIQGILSVVIGIALAPFFGIAGVLAGAIISNIYRNIDLIIFIPKNLTKMPVKVTVLRIVRIAASILVIWLPFLYIKIAVTGYLSWFIFAGIVGIYAVLVTLTIGFLFERSALKSTFQRIMGP